jgi:enamine deaminase RidA (YjgF/YER057c/UK114 family)
MEYEARLKQLGIELPAPPKPFATYSQFTRSGNIIFVAGTGPTKDGKILMTGKLGAGVTVEQGYEAAKRACLNSLAVVRAAAGSLDRVRRILKANVYVASANDFYEQPQVANGATDLLRDIFGEHGLPARAAVGVNVLPMDIPVELELVVEVG